MTRLTNKIRYLLCSAKFEGTPISRSPFEECQAHTHVLRAFQGMPLTHVVSPYLTHAGGTAMPQCGCLTQHPPVLSVCILVTYQLHQ